MLFALTVFATICIYLLLIGVYVFFFGLFIMTLLDRDGIAVVFSFAVLLFSALYSILIIKIIQTGSWLLPLLEISK